MSRKFEYTLTTLIAVALTLLLAAMLAAAQTFASGLGMIPTSGQGPAMVAGIAETDTGDTGDAGDRDQRPNAGADAGAPTATGSALPSLTMPYFSFAPLLPRRTSR